MFARFKFPIALIGFAAAYVVTGKLGLKLAIVNDSASAVWAPTGIALAAVLLLGYRVAPAIFASAFIVHITTAGSVLSSAAIAMGNTAESLAGAYLVQRFAGGRDAFQTAQRMFRFAALLAVLSTPIGATVGVTALALTGYAAWADYVSIWMTWWLGALTGGLVVTPLVVLWATGPWRRRWTEVAEACLLLLLLVPMALIVFAGMFPSDIKTYPLEFLCVPFLMWAAFRLGRREAATATAVVAVISIWGAYHGYGPFTRETRNESFLLLQAFTSVMAVMSIALAAVVAGQKQAEERSRELAVTDPLTGLANYRRLNDGLKSEISRSERTKRPFALLFLDLDGLKRINDRHGHLNGNQALRRVAEALQHCCRAMDTPSRFGGDEFVVILPETDEPGAQLVARRVTDRVAADRSAKPVLSISTGVAIFPRDGLTPATLLAAADRALYQSKSQKASQRKRVFVMGRM